MSTRPDAGNFLVADFAPTSWCYYIKYVRPPPYMNAEAMKKHIDMQCRWARAWMPAPDAPGPHGTGWYEQT